MLINFFFIWLKIIVFGVKTVGLFQDCEASLNHKTELVGKLEAKAQTLTDTVHSLETK